MPRFMDAYKFPTFNFIFHIGFPIIILLIISSSGLVFCFDNSALPRCEFPAIFNFGDSNSDTGGFSAVFGRPPPPYGQSFPQPHSGRYSDGRLIIDFLATTLGLPYLSPYLDSVGSNFSHGANFATTGSPIRPVLQNGYSPVSLDVQFTQYSGFHQKSQILRKQGGNFEGSLPEEDHFRRALYTIDIAQNDFTAAFERNTSTQQVMALVPSLINQVSMVIKNTYNRGGRSFLIHNTGPAGCYPYVLSSLQITAAQIDENGCAAPYNEVAQHFNLGLKKAVLKLRKALPLAAITYVDIYAVKYSLITKAKILGFEKPLVACCGHGGKFNFNREMVCGTKKVVNGKGGIVTAEACENPTVRISWDGIHLTEAANEWVFNQIVNGAFSDPPLPLIHVCHRMDN